MSEFWYKNKSICRCKTKWTPAPSYTTPQLGYPDARDWVHACKYYLNIIKSAGINHCFYGRLCVCNIQCYSSHISFIGTYHFGDIILTLCYQCAIIVLFRPTTEQHWWTPHNKGPGHDPRDWPWNALSVPFSLPEFANLLQSEIAISVLVSYLPVFSLYLKPSWSGLASE